MAELFGRRYTRAELERSVGRLGQIAGIAPVELAFFTWRMLGVGTYVMGLEPGNCPTVEGRIEAGKAGTLPFLEPGERRTYASLASFPVACDGTASHV